MQSGSSGRRALGETASGGMERERKLLVWRGFGEEEGGFVSRRSFGRPQLLVWGVGGGDTGSLGIGLMRAEVSGHRLRLELTYAEGGECDALEPCSGSCLCIHNVRYK